MLHIWFFKHLPTALSLMFFKRPWLALSGERHGFFRVYMHAAKGCELTLRQDKAQPLLLSHSTLRLKRSRSPQTRVGAICSTAIFQMLAGVAAALEQWLDLHMFVV